MWANVRGDDPIITSITWHLQYILLQHPVFGKNRQYKSKLGDAPVVHPIPLHQTDQHPVRAMDIKQSTSDGQVDILNRLLRTAGRFKLTGTTLEPDLDDHVILVHGDLSTYERLLTIMDDQAIEQTPSRRLEYVIFVPGLFHIRMACADAIWRVLLHPKGARKAVDGLYHRVGFMRPRETGKCTQKKSPEFRLLHDIFMVDSNATFWDCFLEEAQTLNPEYTTLEKWADSNPTWSTINQVLKTIAGKYFATYELDEKRLEEDSARDQVFENSMIKHTLYYLYLELYHAINAGDTGRIERNLFSWIPIFRAVGKHKYSSLLTKFLLDLHFNYPEKLQNAIRMNWLCNPSGQKNKFRAVDWLVEINNWHIKVCGIKYLHSTRTLIIASMKDTFSGKSSNHTKEMIMTQSGLINTFTTARKNCATEYFLAVKTTKHTRPNPMRALQLLLNHMRNIRPNFMQLSRKDKYEIPSILSIGMDMMQQLDEMEYDSQDIDHAPDNISTQNEEAAVPDEDEAIQMDEDEEIENVRGEIEDEDDEIEAEEEDLLDTM